MGALAAPSVQGFVNLDAVAGRPTGGGDAIAWLRAGVLEAAPRDRRSRELGTGVLFLPAGEYHLPATDLRELGTVGLVELYVPATVTLWFDPDARLVLGPGVVVEIQGDILAGRQTIFACQGEGADTARVQLTGHRLREVLPEWWGARPGEDCGRALQLAFDAAFHAPGRANTVRLSSPIPVTLSGVYGTSTTLRIGRSPFDPPPPMGSQPVFSGNGFWLRGTTPRSTAGGDSPSAGVRFLGTTSDHVATVLSIEAGFGWLLENILLDAGEGARHALHIAPSEEGSNHQSNGLRQCTFRGGTAWQVAVGPALGSLRHAELMDAGGMRMTVRVVVGVGRAVKDPGTMTRQVLTPNTQDFTLLRMECCLVEVRGGSDTEPLAGGVLLQAGNALPMQIVGCIFRGRARAMVQHNTGALELDGCRFANSAVGAAPKEKQPLEIGPVPQDPNLGPTYFSTGAGCDVFLGLEPPTVAFEPGEALPPPSAVLRVYFRRNDREVSSPTHRLVGNSSATASLTVRDCQTSSRRFLATFDPRQPARRLLEGGTAEGSVVLQNVQQRNAAAREDFNVLPGSIPAVEWNLPGPSELAPALVLLGCHFDGRVVAGPQARHVYSMGTTFSRAAVTSTPGGLGFGGITLLNAQSRLFVL